MSDQATEFQESPNRQPQDNVAGARAEVNATHQPGDTWKNDLKQQTAVCEASGVLPPVKLVEEQPYLPGYTYSKAEADQHAKEILKDGNWSGSDVEFLKAWKAQKDQEELHAMAPSADHASNAKAHPHEALKEEHPQSEKTAIKAGVQQQKFELGATGEEMAWHDWQDRLNHGIYDKMQGQLNTHHLPNGLECKINYTVDKNGGFGWKMTESSGNAEYDKLIAKSIDDTLRYHPELLKFPQGTHKTSYSREATFSTGGTRYGGYSTGATETEQYKE